MFCEKCGAPLKNDDMFCHNCGERVPASVGNAATAHIEQGHTSEGQRNIPGQYYNDRPEEVPRYNRPQTPEETTKKKKKKKGGHKKVVVGVVSLLAATAVIAAGGVIAYNILTSPSYQTVKLISDQKYDEAFEMYANSDKEPELVSKITESLLSQLDSIKNDFTNKQTTYDEAKNRLEEIQQFNLPEIQAQLSEISDYIENMQTSFVDFGKGTEALSQEKYADAVGYLKNVVTDDPDYESAVNSLNEAISKYAEKTLEETAQLASSKDYKSALARLKIVIDDIKPVAKNEEHKPLEDKYNEYKTAFVSEAISQAKEEKENNNYDQAMSIIREAMSVVSDESLNAELTQIEAERPMKLEEIKISESANFTQITDLTATEDVVGNTYSPNNLFQISADRWEEGYADCYLNYKYKKLTGTIAVADSSEITNAALTIYGDKNIIWTSGTMSRTTSPKEIDIDLSKVDWLEIKLTLNEDSYDTLDVLLSDFQFSK